MYKIKRITTTDSETFYEGYMYDGDRERLRMAVNGHDMVEIYDDKGNTSWVKPRNIVSVDLYKNGDGENP